MSNEQVYAGGLLNRALDPTTQPPEIRAFLQAEVDLLRDLILDGMRVVDLGCGTGRHLASATVWHWASAWTISTRTSWRPIASLGLSICIS